MTQWIKSDTGEIIDTAQGQGITVAGTYWLNRAGMERQRPFAFSASTKAATHTATIQLVSEIAGVITNIGSTITPVFGTPAADTTERSLVGNRGIVVSGITGTVYPEALQ